MDCSGCRAYVLEKRASELLGRRYVYSERREENFTMAAALLARAETMCYNLRCCNCCPVNTRSGQFMLHTTEPEPAAWPVFQPVAIPYQVGGDE